MDIAIVATTVRVGHVTSPRELQLSLLRQDKMFLPFPLERQDPLLDNEAAGKIEVNCLQCDPTNVDAQRAVWQNNSNARDEALDPAHHVLKDALDDLLHARTTGRRLTLPDRTAVVVANTMQSEFSRAKNMQVTLQHCYERLLHQASPFVPPPTNEYTLAGWIGDTLSGYIANHCHATGGCYTVSCACSGGAEAVHQASMLLRLGECDAVIAGAVDLSLDHFELVSFDALGVLSKNSTPRPLSRDRNGFLGGEAVGLVLLKRLCDVKFDDGEEVLALLQGVGVSSNGGGALEEPSRDGILRSAQAAFQPKPHCHPSNGNPPADAIIAHATGTIVGDETELAALDELAADWVRQQATPVTSIKGVIGHTKAAAGLLNVIVAVESLRCGWLPGSGTDMPMLSTTISRGSKMTAFQHIRVVERCHRVRHGRGTCVISTQSTAFGGHNVHLVLHSYGPVDEAYAMEATQALGLHDRFPLMMMQFTAGHENDSGDVNLIRRLLSSSSLAQCKAVMGHMWERRPLHPHGTIIVGANPRSLLVSLADSLDSSTPVIVPELDGGAGRGGGVGLSVVLCFAGQTPSHTKSGDAFARPFELQEYFTTSRVLAELRSIWDAMSMTVARPSAERTPRLCWLPENIVGWTLEQLFSVFPSVLHFAMQVTMATHTLDVLEHIHGGGLRQVLASHSLGDYAAVAVAFPHLLSALFACLLHREVALASGSWKPRENQPFGTRTFVITNICSDCAVELDDVYGNVVQRCGVTSALQRAWVLDTTVMEAEIFEADLKANGYDVFWFPEGHPPFHTSWLKDVGQVLRSEHPTATSHLERHGIALQLSVALDGCKTVGDWACKHMTRPFDFRSALPAIGSADLVVCFGPAFLDRVVKQFLSQRSPAAPPAVVSYSRGSRFSIHELIASLFPIIRGDAEQLHRLREVVQQQLLASSAPCHALPHVPVLMHPLRPQWRKASLVTVAALAPGNESSEQPHESFVDPSSSGVVDLQEVANPKHAAEKTVQQPVPTVDLSIETQALLLLLQHEGYPLRLATDHFRTDLQMQSQQVAKMVTAIVDYLAKKGLIPTNRSYNPHLFANDTLTSLVMKVTGSHVESEVVRLLSDRRSSDRPMFLTSATFLPVVAQDGEDIQLCRMETLDSALKCADDGSADNIPSLDEKKKKTMIRVVIHFSSCNHTSRSPHATTIESDRSVAQVGKHLLMLRNQLLEKHKALLELSRRGGDMLVVTNNAHEDTVFCASFVRSIVAELVPDLRVHHLTTVDMHELPDTETLKEVDMVSRCVPVSSPVDGRRGVAFRYSRARDVIEEVEYSHAFRASCPPINPKITCPSRLNDVDVVVTGASGYIGSQLAGYLSQLFRVVWCIGRRPLSQVSSSLAQIRNVRYIQANIGQRDRCAEALSAYDLSGVRYLVHGAGVGIPKPASEISPSSLAMHFNAKVSGLHHVLEVLQTFSVLLPLHLVAIGSLLGTVGLPGSAEYCAANSALEHTCRRRSLIMPRKSHSVYLEVSLVNGSEGLGGDDTAVHLKELGYFIQPLSVAEVCQAVTSVVSMIHQAAVESSSTRLPPVLRLAGLFGQLQTPPGGGRVVGSIQRAGWKAEQCSCLWWNDHDEQNVRDDASSRRRCRADGLFQIRLESLEDKNVKDHRIHDHGAVPAVAIAWLAHDVTCRSLMKLYGSEEHGCALEVASVDLHSAVDPSITIDMVVSCCVAEAESSSPRAVFATLQWYQENREVCRCVVQSCDVKIDICEVLLPAAVMLPTSSDSPLPVEPVYCWETSIHGEHYRNIQCRTWTVGLVQKPEGDDSDPDTAIIHAEFSANCCKMPAPSQQQGLDETEAPFEWSITPWFIPWMDLLLRGALLLVAPLCSTPVVVCPSLSDAKDTSPSCRHVLQLDPAYVPMKLTGFRCDWLRWRKWYDDVSQDSDQRRILFRATLNNQLQMVSILTTLDGVMLASVTSSFSPQNRGSISSSSPNSLLDIQSLVGLILSPKRLIEKQLLEALHGALLPLLAGKSVPLLAGEFVVEAAYRQRWLPNSEERRTFREANNNNNKNTDLTLSRSYCRVPVVRRSDDVHSCVLSIAIQLQCSLSLCDDDDDDDDDGGACVGFDVVSLDVSSPASPSGLCDASLATTLEELLHLPRSACGNDLLLCVREALFKASGGRQEALQFNGTSSTIFSTSSSIPVPPDERKSNDQPPVRLWPSTAVCMQIPEWGMVVAVAPFFSCVGGMFACSIALPMS